MSRKQCGFAVIEGLLIVVIIGLIGFASWYVYTANKNTNNIYNNSADISANQATSNKKATPTQTEISTAPATGAGSITGFPSYPSEGIPLGEVVCAETISKPVKTYCDNVGEKQIKSVCSPVSDENCEPLPYVKFNVKVPAGEYYVYARVSESAYRAYYNEFAKCGNNASCPEAGHKQKIKIVVRENEVVDNVDPSDWYNN